MPGTSINLPSVTLASASAGPLFLLGICIGIWADDPGRGFGVQLSASMIVGIPILGLVAAVVGSLLALLPNLIGAKLMTWLGDHNEAARMPVMWALAGALACAVPVIAFGDGRPDTHSTLIAFTFTGTCCALLCRRRVEWRH